MPWRFLSLRCHPGEGRDPLIGTGKPIGWGAVVRRPLGKLPATFPSGGVGPRVREDDKRGWTLSLKMILTFTLFLSFASSEAVAEWRATNFLPAPQQPADNRVEALRQLSAKLWEEGHRTALRRCSPYLNSPFTRKSFAVVGTCPDRIDDRERRDPEQDGRLEVRKDGLRSRTAFVIFPDGARFASYWDGTNRYRHGVFGEPLEPTALSAYKSILGAADTASDKHRRDRWEVGEDQVFEDRTPRITDLEGFGRTHIVTILTDVTQGASVAVFGLADGELKLLAQTPYIGTPNRWLNVAGIEDFDGSGSAAIALVETPHIGGTLQFWRWVSDREGGGSLELVAEAKDALGYSNHEFGSREQRLSAVEDFDGDGVSDLALPSQDRKTLRLVKAVDGTIEDIAAVPLPATIDKAIGVTNVDGDVVLTVGLEDGSVWAVHRE